MSWELKTTTTGKTVEHVLKVREDSTEVAEALVSLCRVQFVESYTSYAERVLRIENTSWRVGCAEQVISFVLRSSDVSEEALQARVQTILQFLDKNRPVIATILSISEKRWKAEEKSLDDLRRGLAYLKTSCERLYKQVQELEGWVRVLQDQQEGHFVWRQEHECQHEQQPLGLVQRLRKAPKH